MKRWKGNNSGMTLAETVIAVAVAGVSIFSLLYTFPKVKSLVEVAHQKTAAIRACQVEVEELRRQGFSGVNEGVTTQVVTLDSGRNLNAATDDIRAVLTTTVTNIFSGSVLMAKKALVQCQWNAHHSVNAEYLDFILYRNVT